MEPKIGDAVVFVDDRRQERDALLTDVHGGPGDETPSVNLVYVSSDADRKDAHGRQFERESSVVHEEHQSAGGMYWRRSD